MRPALDSYELMPKYMRIYLLNYGWHFNKLLCDYATSLMIKNGKPLEVLTKSQVDELLTKYDVHLDNNIGYDYVFVANMGKADYYGSSIISESNFSFYIKDTIDDEDAGDGTTMRRWYATMIANGIMVDWKEFI